MGCGASTSSHSHPAERYPPSTPAHSVNPTEARLLNELGEWQSDSSGCETVEPSPTVTYLKSVASILVARVQSGINGDVNQFQKEIDDSKPEPPSQKALTRISKWLEGISVSGEETISSEIGVTPRGNMSSSFNTPRVTSSLATPTGMSVVDVSDSDASSPRAVHGKQVDVTVPEFEDSDEPPAPTPRKVLSRTTNASSGTNMFLTTPRALITVNNNTTGS